MREIKFRAWDGEKMLTDIAIVEGKAVPHGYVATWWANTLENVMQYTGFKDKNGKEIYEGDIVEYGLLTGKIIFDSGAFQFEILKSEQSHLIGERDCLIDLSEDGFEIIGNIYENVELLEAAK